MLCFVLSCFFHYLFNLSPAVPCILFPASRSCPADPSPAYADSRCSLTLLALLPSPLPSTTDMHKHTPAANNRGFIQGGHTADTAGPLSRTRIWTWAATMPTSQCLWELLKSAPVRAAHAVLPFISGGLTMTSSGEKGVSSKECHGFDTLRNGFICHTCRLWEKKAEVGSLWYNCLSLCFGF